jgi:hypothetical protein
VAFEDAAGQGIDGDVGGLADLDVDDVGLVDLDLGGDDGHVGEGHQGGAFGVLDADDDGFALADGDVGDEAVEGARRRSCRGRRSCRAGVATGLIRRWPLCGLGLGLGLGERRIALGEGGDGHVVGGLLGVVVLLGDEFVL